MCSVNVLGVFQATGGKSSGAWQPETTDWEGFSRVSATLTSARHEEGPGEIKFMSLYCQAQGPTPGQVYGQSKSGHKVYNLTFIILLCLLQYLSRYDH